jgi:hypothetical protein
MCKLDWVTNLGGGERPKKLQVMLHNPDLKKLPMGASERVRFMESVLDKAYAQRQDDSFVIFVAPEYYFFDQAETAGRRYTKHEFEMVRNHLCEASKKFPRMLIVAGSVYWFEPAINPPKSTGGFVKSYRKLRVHNTAPVILNGNCFSYHKKKDNDCKVGEPEVFDIPAGMHGIFCASGMSMGISMCADYAEITKDYETLRDSGKVEQTEGVDVHIHIASGDFLSAEHCVSRNGGFGIQVDAQSSGIKLFKLKQGDTTITTTTTTTTATTPRWRNPPPTTTEGKPTTTTVELETINLAKPLGDGIEQITVYDPLDCPHDPAELGRTEDEDKAKVDECKTQ